IAGLSAEDTTALIGPRVATPIARELTRRTAGNPLFLKEILRHAASRFAPDWFARDDASAMLQRDLAPPGIRELVAQPGARLDPDSRAIFDAAAVLGERFELADVARLAGRRSAAIEGDLDTLRTHALIETTGQPPTGRFRHPVVREAALALLSPRRSQQLH